MSNGDQPQPVEDAAKDIAKDDAQRQGEAGRPGKKGEATSTSSVIKIGIPVAVAIVLGGIIAVNVFGGGNSQPVTSPQVPAQPPVVAVAPTTPPTQVPTAIPTAIPTDAPTQVPTQVPTSPPTVPPPTLPPTPTNTPVSKSPIPTGMGCLDVNNFWGQPANFTLKAPGGTFAQLGVLSESDRANIEAFLGGFSGSWNPIPANGTILIQPNNSIVEFIMPGSYPYNYTIPRNSDSGNLNVLLGKCIQLGLAPR